MTDADSSNAEKSGADPAERLSPESRAAFEASFKKNRAALEELAKL